MSEELHHILTRCNGKLLKSLLFHHEEIRANVCYCFECETLVPRSEVAVKFIGFSSVPAVCDSCMYAVCDHHNDGHCREFTFIESDQVLLCDMCVEMVD